MPKKIQQDTLKKKKIYKSKKTCQRIIFKLKIVMIAY